MNPSLSFLPNLRYKPLPHLIGQRVVVSRLQNSTREMARLVSKYGFLDLSFTIASQFLTSHDTVQASTLAELGFIRKQETRRDREQGDCPYLDKLAEGIEDGTSWLRLFLTSGATNDTLKRVLDQFRKITSTDGKNAAESAVFRMELAISRLADTIEQRLPMTFTMKDACISNSKAIWMASHGYL